MKTWCTKPHIVMYLFYILSMILFHDSYRCHYNRLMKASFICKNVISFK